MEEMMTAADAVAKANPLVGYWMNWMGIIMLASIIFVWKHKAARYILGAMILVMIIGMIIWSMTKNVHLIGIAHLLVWGPLAYYLIKSEKACSDGKWKTPYGFWLILVVLTIIISLLFDVRDIYLVMTGVK